MIPIQPYVGATSNPPIPELSFVSVIVPTTVTILIGAVFLLLARRRLVTRHASGSDQHKIGRALFASYCVNIILSPILISVFGNLAPHGLGSFLLAYILLPILISIGIFCFFARMIFRVAPDILRKSHYITSLMLAFVSLFFVPFFWVFWIILVAECSR